MANFVNKILWRFIPLFFYTGPKIYLQQYVAEEKLNIAEHMHKKNHCKLDLDHFWREFLNNFRCMTEKQICYSKRLIFNAGFGFWSTPRKDNINIEDNQSSKSQHCKGELVNFMVKPIRLEEQKISYSNVTLKYTCS